MDHPTVEAEDQAVAQERATIPGYAMGVRGLVKGQENSHSGLLAKVEETMHTLCILMTVLHRHVVHAFNVERISFFAPIAHFCLSRSLHRCRICPPWSDFFIRGRPRARR